MTESNENPNPSRHMPQAPPPPSPYSSDTGQPQDRPYPPDPDQQGQPHPTAPPYQPQAPFDPQGQTYAPPVQPDRYQAFPPHGQANQQHYQPNTPYEQAYRQHYQPGAPQYPYYQDQPYYPNPPYGQPEKKGRVWPWVLSGCLIIAILGLGGCVGCIACSTMLVEEQNANNRDYPYDNGYDLGYDYDSFDDLSLGYGSAYTLADIEELAQGLPSAVEDGICTTGMFEVGSGKDIESGLYYLEGSQNEEGSFMVFKEDGSGDSYTLAAHVSYFGNYFADLAEGDVIVFLAPETKRMHPAKDAAYEISDPIVSGCYRVGIDIPAGTYTVTYQKGSPEDASQEAGVYIMDDLAWGEESITEYHYLIAGGSHTVTLVDGQYVELYEATMVASS